MLRCKALAYGVLVLSLTSCSQSEPATPAQLDSPTPVDAGAIVVGAGLSGLAAAVEMGRSGLDVLVLDMNSVMGGHAVLAGGFAVVGTPIQERQGFEDSPELAYADWMQWTEDGDPEWTRFYAENSREMLYDWLTDMGVEFVHVLPSHENSVPRFHFTARGALDAVLALYRSALGLPNVSFLWNHRVESLVLREGRISGVVARSLRTNETQTLYAPHVVLATGGFEGDLERVLSNWNPDLPRPDRLLLGASIHARGSGHDLASEVGALLTRMDRHYIYINGMVDPRDPQRLLAITAGNDHSLWLNAQGQRFTNETGRDKMALADLFAQDPISYWAIFDDTARSQFAMRGRVWINNPMAGHPVLDNPETTHKAQTLDALASMTGLPSDTLAASVQRFNQLIEAGHDTDFGRFAKPAEAPPKIQQPPFYAMQLFPMARKSMGGVAVDIATRALNSSGKRIPGLYAVGELTGSVGINGKHGMDGMFLGPALLTGRVAGRAIVAAHVSSKGNLAITARSPALGELGNWKGATSADELESLLAETRAGYWHFEISHALVLERQYDCTLCHSAQVPFQPVNNRQVKLAQSQLCAHCHSM